MIIESIELNWLCRNMKKVTSSQVAILVLNWIKHNFSLGLSLKSLKIFILWLVALMEKHAHKSTKQKWNLFFMIFCTIWYHLHNFKNVKSIYGGVLPLVKVTLLHGCFSHFLNCTNGTKSLWPRNRLISWKKYLL